MHIEKDYDPVKDFFRIYRGYRRDRLPLVGLPGAQKKLKAIDEKIGELGLTFALVLNYAFGVRHPGKRYTGFDLVDGREILNALFIRDETSKDLKTTPPEFGLEFVFKDLLVEAVTKDFVGWRLVQADP